MSTPLNITSLSASAPVKKRKPGRPSNLSMPALPQDLLDGMTDLEKQHFFFCRDAYTQEYITKYECQPTPSAQICIVMASLEYINMWRLQVEQMVSKTLVSQARQHPAIQFRAWLQSIGLQEKEIHENKPSGDADKAAARAALLGLSS